METFSALLAFCAGNSPVHGEFPIQRPVTRSFDVFFDLRWIRSWVNNREAGDLRRQQAHYDVIDMILWFLFNYSVGGCGRMNTNLYIIMIFVLCLHAYMNRYISFYNEAGPSTLKSRKTVVCMFLWAVVWVWTQWFTYITMYFIYFM